MDPLILQEMKAVLSAMEKRHGAVTQSSERLIDVLGVSYVQKLEAMSDEEALQYLKDVEEPELSGAYLVLSTKLPSSALAEICRQYLARSTFRARLLGIGGLGIWLLGTRDAAASRILAKIARDPSEHASLRRKAYDSLECINKGRSTALKALIGDPNSSPPTPETWLEGVDWSFVDSFLETGNAGGKRGQD